MRADVLGGDKISIGQIGVGHAYASRLSVYRASAGYHDITFSHYTRYVADAADMARILRGEKETDFPYSHDLAVQRTLLQACQLPLDK